LLDLSAAFDTIDHASLIDRPSVSFVIRGMALNWFGYYLSGRKQCVMINGDISPDVALTTGVPQGSVIGPVLFTTYVNPVRTLATVFGVKMHQFSDDTREYLSFPILPDFGIKWKE
jgi:multisubunit Na+/H+ antiporter MnhB subunit